MEVAYLNSPSQFEIINWNRFSSTLIIEVERNKKIYTSTAVVVGKNMLITAAHSVDQFDRGAIVVGDSYKNAQDKIEIKRCYIHPGYNPSKSLYVNDIAVIILNKNLPDNIFIEKIPESISLGPGEVLDRVGFGMRENKNIRTWTNPSFVTSTFNLTNFILEDTLSVVGDSGGPIYRNNNGELELIGIHSTLEGSNKTYIVNLAYYKDWIEEHRALRSI
ncbi:MAG: hypothetical protein CME62_04290 [Halobacteriovoraceae bacterium]|nr:hypothetical protein [Halobacteriovoraceae bacterium]|tara:strand:- start:2050 stop:2706 length:657 start_codon:yes stop_codon:yes gene_type:complete